MRPWKHQLRARALHAQGVKPFFIGAASARAVLKTSAQNLTGKPLPGAYVLAGL